MSLSGNLKTMDLPELLQWLTLGRKTGVLTFIKGKTKNYIYFKDGVIVSSNSNDPTKYLGQFLLFQGKITETQLKRAIEVQQQGGLSLGKVLVNEGIVPQEEIERSLRRRTEEVVYDLFLWEDGFFHFTEEGFDLEQLILIRLDLNAIIFEGVRRKDEWVRIREVFPGNNVVLGLSAGVDPRQVQLTPLQKKLLFLVNLGKTIAEMILELHGSDFLVNFELYQLYDKGLIEVREVLEERAEPEEAANPFKRGLELMQARRYADAIVLFQEILAGDPNNFRAHELIEEAEKAICADYYSGALGETQVPYFVISQTALTRHSLTHQEGFVASRINGTWDIKAIVMLSPLREIEILRIIDKLLQLKIIALR